MFEPDSTFGLAATAQRQLSASWTGRFLRNRWVDVPPEILQRTAWPGWRRMLNRPDLTILAQIDAWGHLAQAVWDTTALPPEPLSVPRRPGIFGLSRVYWNNVVPFGARDCALSGWSAEGTRTKRVAVRNPHGHLVLSAAFDGFACDITNIEGIGASKSQERFFESVDAFGRDYCEYLKTPIDCEGLAKMLNHREIRILHGSSSDGFGLDMWDGRLFLNNSGGSHHFAGAAYIARAIGKPVPLSGCLQVKWLNEPAWRWLLDQYRVVHIGPGHRLPFPKLALIAQECLELDLPGNVGQGKFLFISRKARALNAILRMFLHMGVAEVTSDLNGLLTHQSHVLQRLTHRWPNQVRLTIGSASVSQD